MQPNDPMLALYRLAVQRMKALPANDPRNWNQVTQIHVTFCPHSNWFFLPWHRAYLASFERICRQITENDNFALPYWDWTTQPVLPAALTDPTVDGQPNPLFDSTRELQPNTPMPPDAVGEPIMTQILAETNFEMFGSTRPTGQTDTSARWLRAPGRTTQLEGQPHNGVHVTIGGDMGDMNSPLDPIFWLHHCNVDRTWARWTAQGRTNTTDPLWATYSFNGQFQVPQGNGMTAYNVGVSDVLDHMALGYTYPDLPRSTERVVSETRLPAPRVLTSQAPVGVARLRETLSTRLTLPPREAGRAAPPPRAGAPAGGPGGGPGGPPGGALDLNALLREEAPLTSQRDSAGAPGPAPGPGAGGPGPGAGGPPPDLGRERVFSIIEKITTAGGNGAFVNVFVNSRNPNTTDPRRDPNFVGAFGLFGLRDHTRQHGGMTIQVEITQALARLRQESSFNGQLDVQLVPTVARGNGLALKVERINIATL
jgi:tyrosinase